MTDRLKPFYAMDILSRAQALEAQGRTICHLEFGEPSAPPAPGVISAAAAALPGALKYTQAKGRVELRQALAADYQRRHGVTLDPGRIIVTTGSSAAFLLAFLGAVPRGGAIAVTRPGYPAYLNIIEALGLTAVEIPLRPDNGWHLEPSAIRAAHARAPFSALLFASPANPTGAAADPQTLAAIADTCRALGVTFISDEIYHGLTYVGPNASALEVDDNAIVINSFSKFYCMTGWRLGWMVVPDPLTRRIEMLAQNMFISAPTLPQIAGVAALADRAYGEAQLALYAQNRLILSEGLVRLGFGATAPADGAFYAYVDVSRFSSDSMAFCRAMLDEAGVAATPGEDFDRIEGKRYVRFSYAGSRETVGEALERLSRFLPK